jgi:integrase/recombinase XerD
MIAEWGLRLEERGGCWSLSGPGSEGFVVVNEYLSYLSDRNYSPKTVRAYGFDLLAFCRWLRGEGVELAGVTTEVLLRFLRACREATIPGRPGPNVVTLSGRRIDQYAAATINRRLAAISGLFTFVVMRDPQAVNPVPKGREARWRTVGERSGMLAHTARRPKNRSSLRLREPRRLPRALPQAEAAELLASFRTWRDRAIAGLMLYCGLRSAEVLGLDVADADIGGRWLRVTGKGSRWMPTSRR